MTKYNLTFAVLLLAGLLVFASSCPKTATDQPAETSGTSGQTTTTPPAAPATGWTGNARDFTYSKYDGSTAKMSELAGTPIVLNFWGAW